MEWTNDQKNSIIAPPADIVVSAAAGSGKTQVLTTRITERLKDVKNPISVENFLVVTFTKAAAAEMKERIGKSLRSAIKEEKDTATRAHLKKQLSLLGSAEICTIDSFCYNVVKQNFFKVDLPSDISIGESGELSLLKLSALEKTVDVLYCALERAKGTELNEENNENADIFEENFPDKEEASLILKGFEMITEIFSHDKKDSDFSENSKGRGDYTDMITALHRKSQSAAYPEKWLYDMADAYNCENYTDSPIGIYAFNTCKEIIADAIKTLTDLCLISRENGIGYETALESDIAALSCLQNAPDYDTLYSVYHSNEPFARLSKKKKDADPDISSQIKSVRDNVKALFDTKSAIYSILQFSSDKCNDVLALQYPQVKALCSGAVLLDRIYYQKMVSKRILDFSACAHTALKIISEDGMTLSDTGESLKTKYDEIYIDEFQDSNDLQDIMFSLISKGRTFLVGDVKQSIYGFRNADPTIFMNKCNNSSFDENALKRKIFLSMNFRSSLGVVNSVNSIFDVVMTDSVSKIDYRKDHRLDYGADFMKDSYPEDKCEIAIIQKDGDAREQEYNEALYIADKVRELVEGNHLVWDKETSSVRPVRFSDIVVLSRGIKNKIPSFEKAFAVSNIPCYIDGGNDLYETNEVGQIVDILNLIDNERNDIALASTLRSPMFLFDENELLEIKLSSEKSFHESFYGICHREYTVGKSLYKKCRRFYNQLLKWRKISQLCTVEELITRIYTDTCICSNVLSFPDGQMRRANLDLLLEKAEEFERSSYTGLFNFVTYIEKIKKTADNVSEAKSVSEKMNVVRIMTIHKSKGLEFPVVFLCGCANKYHASAQSAGGLIMHNMGICGFNVVNPMLHSRYKSPVQHTLSLLEKRESYAEEMRLFYVALTRAREKLFVVATMNGYDDFINKSFEILKTPTSNEIFNCNNYISLLALSYKRGADKYWSVNELSPREIQDAEESLRKGKPEFVFDENISQLLDFEYPYKSVINLPAKASVSLLKSIDINLSVSDNGEIVALNSPCVRKLSLKKPAFEGACADGTFFGSAHHKFLQYYDYNGKSVREQLDAMKEANILSDDEFDVINVSMIEDFIKSSLALMMKNATILHREEPFVIKLPADEISPLLPSEECICIQGIIDCYFEKDDSTVILVDYKTDKYDDPGEIAEKYKKQLYYYEKALKIKYKDKIVQKFLYLLHKNDIIEIV